MNMYDRNPATLEQYYNCMLRLLPTLKNNMIMSQFADRLNLVEVLAKAEITRTVSPGELQRFLELPAPEPPLHLFLNFDQQLARWYEFNNFLAWKYPTYFLPGKQLCSLKWKISDGTRNNTRITQSLIYCGFGGSEDEPGPILSCFLALEFIRFRRDDDRDYDPKHPVRFTGEENFELLNELSENRLTKQIEKPPRRIHKFSPWVNIIPDLDYAGGFGVEIQTGLAGEYAERQRGRTGVMGDTATRPYGESWKILQYLSMDLSYCTKMGEGKVPWILLPDLITKGGWVVVAGNWPRDLHSMDPTYIRPLPQLFLVPPDYDLSKPYTKDGRTYRIGVTCLWGG